MEGQRRDASVGNKAWHPVPKLGVAHTAPEMGVARTPVGSVGGVGVVIGVVIGVVVGVGVSLWRFGRPKRGRI